MQQKIFKDKMDIGFDVIGSLVIGILIGYIANKLPKKNKLGLFTSFSIGMIGALLGSFVLNLFRLDYESLTSNVLIGYATAASVAAIFLYTAFIINRKQEQEEQKQQEK